MIMRAEQGRFYLPNLLESSTKFILAPVFLSLALLSGCEEVGMESSSSVGGYAFEGKLEVHKVKPAKENSSAEVKVRIITDKGNDIVAGDIAFDNAVEVRLNWECWQWQHTEGEAESSEQEINRGSAKLNVADGAGSGTLTIDDLPGTSDIIIAEDDIGDRTIHCEVSVKDATILGNSQALKEFRERYDEDVSFIEYGIADFQLSPEEATEGTASLALEISEIVPGQSASQVSFKLTLGRFFNEFKAVVAGDKLFDDNVDIDLEWSCSPSGNGSDKLSIAAGKASIEKTYTNFPKKQPDDEVACTITATVADTEIKDIYDQPLEAIEHFVIDELELTVIVTENSPGKPINYVVSESANTLETEVDLQLSCNSQYHGLLSLKQNRSSILYDKKISDLNSTGDGSIFAWSHPSANCTLIASSGSGADRKRGRSAHLSVGKHQKLFDLNKQGQLVTADGNKMTHAGKVYVYPYAKPQDTERELVGYIDVPVGGVASGTKLQISASDSNKVSGLTVPRGYFIFYEKSASEVIVFYTKINN